MNNYSRMHHHLHYHTCSWKQIFAYSFLGACVATYTLKGGCTPIIQDTKKMFFKLEEKLEEKVKKFIDEVKK